MQTAAWVRSCAFAVVGLAAMSLSASAATIPINSARGYVLPDNGGVYSGTPLGTLFSGSIDDATFSGELSDGTTSVSFGCCIAAGGLEIFNDQAIEAVEAGVPNFLTQSNLFQAGQLYDSVNIEGDAAVAGGGRIEIGISYLRDASAFSDTSLGN